MADIMETDGGDDKFVSKAGESLIQAVSKMRQIVMKAFPGVGANASDSSMCEWMRGGVDALHCF